MKIFEKVRNENKRKIYFCGIKILSYKKRKNETRDLVKQIENLTEEISFIKNWQQDFYQEQPVKYPIRLSENEINKLVEKMNQAKIYLEYGLGGSTFLALSSSVQKITSVESDINWIYYIKSWSAIREAIIKDNRLNIQYANIGITGPWGNPIDDSCKVLYPEYSMNVWNMAEAQNVDTIFVDGRFRVACVLASILNCNKNATIMVHDYLERETYHVIEEFLDVVEVIDTLAIFKIKKDIDLNKVKSLYDTYKFIKD